MIDMLNHFDILNKELSYIMPAENKIPLLPGDRITLAVFYTNKFGKKETDYFYGVVRELYFENATRLFAKTKKIRVADMPEYAAGKKWKESAREKCELFFESKEFLQKNHEHAKSIWVWVEFTIAVGKIQKKRLYISDILRLQKENRIVIMTPDKL